jgi:hypothetical protein
MMKNPDETLERGCYPSPAGELEGGHDRHPREDWWRFVSPRHLSCVDSGTVIDHRRCLTRERAPMGRRASGIMLSPRHRTIRHYPHADDAGREQSILLDVPPLHRKDFLRAALIHPSQFDDGAIARRAFHRSPCSGVLRSRGDFLRRSGATTVKVIHVPARYWNRRKFLRRVRAVWFWQWPSRSVMRCWKRR